MNVVIIKPLVHDAIAGSKAYGAFINNELYFTHHWALKDLGDNMQSEYREIFKGTNYECVFIDEVTDEIIHKKSDTELFNEALDQL